MTRHTVLNLRYLLLSAFPVLVVSALVWKLGTGAGRASVARLVECADRLVPPAALAALAAVLIAAARGPAGRRTLLATRPGHSSHFLIGHLVILLAFGVVTALITNGYFNSNVYEVDGHFDSSKYLTNWSLWFTIWAGLGAAAFASWAAAAVPAARPLLAPTLAGLAVGFSAWTLGCCTRDLFWQPLSDGTLRTVDFLLLGLFPDTECRPAEYIVGPPAFAVKIEPACSGYEGIGLVCVFLAAYLWAYRADLRLPHALLLLPIGVVVIWLANTVRIVALVAVGVWVSPAVALDGFHSHAGWISFIAVAVGLVALSRRRRFFSVAPPAEEPVACDPNPVAPYLAPLLVLLAATMVTGAFTSGFDHLYPVRVVAVAVALWVFRRAYVGWQWGWSWTAVGIGAAAFGLWMALESLHADPATGSVIGDGLAALPPWWAAAWLVFRVVGAVVTVPLAEELAFRGYLTRRLVSEDFEGVSPRHFTWVSFLISSAAFGALHGRWLAGTLAGMLYALAVYRRGRLTDAVVAHATTNALLAAYVLATGSWALW